MSSRSSQAYAIVSEAAYARRHLKWMARGRIIFLKLPKMNVELTRKSTYDYLTALGDRPVTLTIERERLLIGG